jgi:putative aldouronate transport system substrate-binding protein
MHFWTTEWQEKMPILVNSGEDLGIFNVGQGVDYSMQAKNGAFYPMDELFEKYGTGTRALFPESVWDAMRINGKIYTIPTLKDNCYIMNAMYNEEMAEELGVKEDLENMLYKNAFELEDIFMRANEKRKELYGESKIPLLGSTFFDAFSLNFAVEQFIVNNSAAVCNIPGINDIAGYEPETVFNLYETPEFRELALLANRMYLNKIVDPDCEEKGSEWEANGEVLAWYWRGFTYLAENFFSDDYTARLMLPARTWADTFGYNTCGTVISSNCNDPERAMMLLEMVNTDPDFATLVRFGIEGEHYLVDSEGKMTFEGSPRNSNAADRGYFYWYGAYIGNIMIVRTPEDLTGPDNIMITRIQDYNNAALPARHLGFVPDLDPISNEVAACANVINEYRKVFLYGMSESQDSMNKAVDDFIAKLRANGSQTILEEMQRQVDAWRAEND